MSLEIPTTLDALDRLFFQHLLNLVASKTFPESYLDLRDLLWYQRPNVLFWVEQGLAERLPEKEPLKQDDWGRIRLTPKGLQHCSRDPHYSYMLDDSVRIWTPRLANSGMKDRAQQILSAVEQVREAWAANCLN